jgi:hypothetical protein
MEDFCSSQKEALEELERLAPGAPFLALGQTVFWDEPMKGGVLQASRRLGFDRAFVSGIHDTDYFAKYPHRELRSGYAALPHNDTDTQALWSAAGEFSTLFGSETVVTRERLASAGGRVAEVAAQRPGYLDETTEAFGWRGIVSFGRQSQTTAETPLRRLFDTLYSTFDWAIQSSLECVVGKEREKSEQAAEALRSVVCLASEGAESLDLAEYYRRLAPKMFDLVAGEGLGVQTTRTTELLKFNTQTCSLPRFQIVGLFLDQETRDLARSAYDHAVEGTQTYNLERFGAGALPFDVYIPGVGRGTLRLGTRGGVVMADEPVGFSFKRPIESVAALAEVLEKKFGPDVVLVGKAVALLGMLASEFVFVFHEGASGYVPASRNFHRLLGQHAPRLNPILRVRYHPWDSIAACKAWLRLPEPLRGPFGVEELSAESFAKRWRAVTEEQSQLLAKLAKLRRPLQLIEFLDASQGGKWSCLAQECQEIHRAMSKLDQRVKSVRAKRAKVVKEFKRLKADRAHVEAQLGRHWREKIFEKRPSSADLAQREAYMAELAGVIAKIEDCRARWKMLFDEQAELVRSEHIAKARDRRKSIAFEAELMRLKLVREAVLATDGLRRAGHRPSAWWFPLVSPSGCWRKATMKSATYYLEPLV